MKVQTVTNLNELVSIKNEWSELQSRDEKVSTYLSFEWFKTAFEILDQDKRLFVLCVREGKKLVAIAPLLMTNTTILGIPFTRICFIDNPHTPNQGIIVSGLRQDVFKTLASYLKKATKFFTVLDLEEMRCEEDNFKQFLLSLDAEGFFISKENKNGCFSLKTDIPFDELLSTKKPRVKKEFRRKLSRLEKLGRIDLKLIQNTPDIYAHLDIFFQFYKRTWKGAESRPEFYYSLADSFSEINNIFLFVLTVNDEPVAFLFSILSKGTILGIKTTYDPSYYAFSPGIVLFHKCIEFMCKDSRVQAFDIGRGNERFKKEWTTYTHKQVKIFCAYPNIYNRLLLNFKYILKPRLKRSPVISKMVRAIKNNKSITIETIENKYIEYVIQLPDHEFEYYMNGLDIRYTVAADNYRLAIAMEARNIKQIEDLLNESSGIIISRDHAIMAYFWIDNFKKAENFQDKSFMTISSYGIAHKYKEIAPANELFKRLLSFLSAENIRELRITADENDASLLKAIGFCEI